MNENNLDIPFSKSDEGASLSSKAILSKPIYKGYSDAELELLTNPPEIDRGIAPWLNWPSELYSFGRIYREIGVYPRLFPLFVYSDHGVHKVPEFAPHELNNNANVQFVFNQERVLKNLSNSKKKAICVTHPWVTYRRRNSITQVKDSKGTLVFFSHSCDGVEQTGHDTDEYFGILEKLPDKYKPLVLCMHMHDINKGYHKRLRKHGIPLVTAGITSSTKFVDNFYDIVRNFRYATSNSAGSQLYYCAEMGIPYFLLGERPKHENFSNPDLPPGIMGAFSPTQKELIQIEQALFEKKLDHVSLHQKMYVEWMLGLNSEVGRFEVSWILWREFFRNWKQWSKCIRPIGVWLLGKLFLLNVVKKIRHWLRRK